jgi:ParB family chromosome partitioning protein
MEATMSDVKKRGLGRGLGALLPEPGGAPSRQPPAQRTYFAAGIEDLYPSPEQPRRRFDDAKLDELAESMTAHGVIVPLVVRPRGEGGYYLIAGELV